MVQRWSLVLSRPFCLNTRPKSTARGGHQLRTVVAQEARRIQVRERNGLEEAHAHQSRVEHSRFEPASRPRTRPHPDP